MIVVNDTLALNLNQNILLTGARDDGIWPKFKQYVLPLKPNWPTYRNSVDPAQDPANRFLSEGCADLSWVSQIRQLGSKMHRHQQFGDDIVKYVRQSIPRERQLTICGEFCLSNIIWSKFIRAITLLVVEQRTLTISK